MKKILLGSLMALLIGFVFSCALGAPAADTTAPTVISTLPANLAVDFAVENSVTATFSKAMDPATINGTTFTVAQGVTPVAGVVTYSGKTATFAPAFVMSVSTVYTATITTGVKDVAGNQLAAKKIWSFTTGVHNPATVALGLAGTYAILAQSRVSTVPDSIITGDVGLSPAAATFINGFALTLDASTIFSVSTQVTGKVYATNYGVPTPANLTTATTDMMTAYTDAAGRAPDVTDLGAGDLSGLTIARGVYKFGTGVLINTDVTLTGTPTDVFIFEIAGDLTVAANKKVILSGGVLAKNIFWQVGGGAGAAIAAGAHFQGNILAATAIVVGNTTVMNGSLLSQTAVNLDSSTVTKP